MCLACRPCGRSVRDFLDGVAVPARDAELDGAFLLDDALAGEAAVALQAGGFFDAVFLGLGRLAEVPRALLDIHMAGGAGADAAARVLDIDVGAERHLE